MFPALSAATVLVTTAVAEVAISRDWATVAPTSVGSEPERTLNTAVALVVTPAKMQVPATSRVVPATLTATASVAKAAGMFAVMACPTASHTPWLSAMPEGIPSPGWFLAPCRAPHLPTRP